MKNDFNELIEKFMKINVIIEQITLKKCGLIKIRRLFF